MTKIMEKLFLTLLTRRMHKAIIEIKNEILQKYHCGVFYHKKLFNLKGLFYEFKFKTSSVISSYFFNVTTSHHSKTIPSTSREKKKAMIPFSTQLSTQSLTVDSSETYF